MSTSLNDGIEVVVAPEELALAEESLHAGRGERARLLRDALINASGILVPSLVALVMVPLMLRGLGTATYGLWIAVAAMVAISASFDFGLGWTVVRQIAADPALEPAPHTVQFFQAAASAYLGLGVLSGAVVCALGTWGAQQMELSAELHHIAPLLFALAGVALVGDRMVAFTVAVLHGMRRFGSAVLLMGSIAVVRGAGIALLMSFGAGIGGLMLWHMAAALLAGGAGLLLLARLQPRWRMSARVPVWRTLHSHFAFGMASQLTSVATSVTWQAGALVVGGLAGTAAIVPLHVGQRFPLFASAVGWRSAEVAFPAASQDANQQVGEEILRATTRWTVVAVLPICVTLTVLAPHLLQNWLGAIDPAAVAVLRITAAAVLADSLGVGAIHILWGRGRANAVLVILGTVAAATALLTWLLVPRVGVPGAALALAVSLFAGAVVALVVAARSARTSASGVVLHALGRATLPAALCAGAALLLVRTASPASWPALFTVAAVSGAAYLLGMFAFGLYPAERALVGKSLNDWCWMLAGRPTPLHSQLGNANGQVVTESSSWLLRLLKRIRPLRSLWHLLLSVREMLFDTPERARLAFDQLHQQRDDPWGYLRIPARGELRFRRTDELLDQLGVKSAGRVLELGCSEGLYTVSLAARAQSLLAVDISATAVDRARERCRGLSNVTFRTWDLRRDPLDGPFDLIVAMSVLETLDRPSDLHAARHKLVSLLRPGGLLFVETTRVSPPLENQWWRRWLHRGRWLNAFISEDPRLRTVVSSVEPAAIRSVFQRSSEQDRAG